MTTDSTDEFFSSFYRDPPYPSRGRTYSCTRERWRGKRKKSPQSPLAHLNELMSFNDVTQQGYNQQQQNNLKRKHSVWKTILIFFNVFWRYIRWLIGICDKNTSYTNIDGYNNRHNRNNTTILNHRSHNRARELMHFVNKIYFDLCSFVQKVTIKFLIRLLKYGCVFITILFFIAFIIVPWMTGLIVFLPLYLISCKIMVNSSLFCLKQHYLLAIANYKLKGVQGTVCEIFCLSFFLSFISFFIFLRNKKR